MLPTFALQYLAANRRALPPGAWPSSLTGREDANVECNGRDETSSVWSAWLHQTDGRRLALNGRHPMREAETWLLRELDGRALPDVVFVVGAGLGFIVDAIIERSSVARVVVLEPEPSLVAGLLARRDWSHLIEAGRLRLFVGPSFDGADEAWRALRGTETEPLVMVHPVIGRERADQVAAALKRVRRIIADARANDEARRLFAVPYLLNTLENVPRLARERDVRSLFGKFSGRPVIVAAAGPSLDATLDELKSVRDRAIVVAVDTALRPLLLAGIEPEFVVAVDPGEANAIHLRGLPPCPSTRLIAEASVAPAIFDGFRDRTFFFRVASNDPWPKLLQHGIDVGVLDAWGSVLVTAVDFAAKIGGNPVVLAGCDLSYTDGRPYCRGTAFEDLWMSCVEDVSDAPELWRRILRDATMVEDGIDGLPCTTAPRLVAFRDGLRDRLGRHPATRFVNAAGRGILTGPGLELSSLSAAFEGVAHHRPVDGPRIEDKRAADVNAVSSMLLGLLSQGAPEWESALGVVLSDEFLGRLLARLHGKARTSVGYWGDEGRSWRDWFDLAEHAQTHAARWAAVGRHGMGPLPRWPFERVHLLRRATSLDRQDPEAPVAPGQASPAQHEVDAAVSQSAMLLGRLLEADRLAYGTLPREPLHRLLASGRAPSSSVFEWMPAVQADVTDLQRCLTVLAAAADPAQPGPSAYRALANDRVEDDPHPADREAPRRPWTDVDACARHVLLVEWIAVISALSGAAERQGAARDAGRSLAGWLAAHPTVPLPIQRPGLQLLVTCSSDGDVASTMTASLDLSPQRASRLLTGRWRRVDGVPAVSGSGCPLLRVPIGRDNGAVAVSLRGHDDADPDPRTKWLTSDGGWFEMTDLRERGLPPCAHGRPFDDASAILIPSGGTTHSFRVHEDGTCEALEPWPMQLVGEARWPSGGTLAWGQRDSSNLVGIRTRPGGPCTLDETPFWAWNAAVPEDGGSPLWATHSQGLWEWTPGLGGRRLADVPSSLGIRIVADGIRLDPSFKSQKPPYLIKRTGDAVLYRPRTGDVVTLPLSSDGPCWYASTRAGWTAESYVNADGVRLAHRDGAEVWLACFSPVAVAWAGASLIVTTVRGNVFMFPRLLSKLDAFEPRPR